MEISGSNKDFRFPVAMRSGETPVPISNTMVKTWTADGTMLETAWESRWLPDIRGYSSVGRAPALQAGGQGFESLYLHGSAETTGCLKERMREGLIAQPVRAHA